MVEKSHNSAMYLSGVLLLMMQALVAEPEDHIKAASAWSLGQIGRHTPDHARALAEGDVLRHLLVRNTSLYRYLYAQSKKPAKPKEAATTLHCVRRAEGISCPIQ